MKKQILAVATAALVSMMTVVPAMAQGDVTVTGGSLSATGKAINFAGVTLDGTIKTSLGTTVAWDAADATGSGDGWNVTIAATDFVHSVVAAQTIPVTGFTATLSDASILPAEGTVSAKPTTLFGTETALTVAAKKLASAALDQGMGSYTLAPTFNLTLPAETYAGTYESIVTVTIATGP